MSRDPVLHLELLSAHVDAPAVRFPPGLGLIPPRDVPRPHKVRPSMEWQA
jgi:hypothetical protein